MKKGRHRRFEEARALKRTTTDLAEAFGAGKVEPCAECGGIYGKTQASWCPGAPECESAVRFLEAEALLDAYDDDDEYDDEEDEDGTDDELELDVPDDVSSLTTDPGEDDAPRR